MKKYVFAAAARWVKSERLSLASKTSNPKILYRLVFDPDPDVRCDVARNRNAPKYVLKALFDNSNGIDPRVRQNISEDIATNPACDDDLLLYMFDNGYSISRGNTVYYIVNRTQNSAVLSKIAEHPDTGIRTALAANNHTPMDIIEELAYDASSSVRDTVASRDDVTPEILEILSYDPDPYVCSRVFNNPNTPTERVYEYLESFDYSNTSRDGFEILSQVVSRNDITADVLKSVFDRLKKANPQYDEWGNGKVYRAIANSPNISPDLMYEMCSLGGNGDIAQILIKRLNLPDNVVQRISDCVINNVFRYAPSSVKVFVLSNTNNAEYLTRVYNESRGSDWPNSAYREAIARNPATPMPILERLSNDRTYSVREAANSALKALSERQADTQTRDEERARLLAQPISPTEWRISPYTSESYSDLAEELDGVITKAMNSVARALKCKLTYQFDVDDYDNATEVTITTNTGKEFTVDAQQFLALVTSDPSKNVCAKRTAEYITKIVQAQ